MRHLEHLLGLLKKPSRKGKGYRACCPAHDDTNPSLDIVMDDENNIILRCRSAGCKLTDILKAIDMCPDDLSPDPDEEIFTNDDYDLAQSDAPSCDSKSNDVDFDLRSKIYSTLCDGLELSEEHREDLQRRGLDDSDINERGYRSLTNAAARGEIAHLRTMHSDIELLSVPGFVPDPDAGVRLVGPGQGLIIPCRDPQERIVALKVRRDDGSGQVGKYSCISGGGGPSCGTPAHVPLGVKQPVPTVRITEGELKADIATVRSDIPTIGIAGVSNWPSALPVLQSLGVKLVYLAFDSDCQTKPHVARPLVELDTKLREQGYDVNIEIWNLEDGKGIDDLLASGKEPKVLAGEDGVRFLESLQPQSGSPTEPEQITTNNASDANERILTNAVKQFPLHIFPTDLQTFIRQAATSVGCSIDLVAIPILAVTATAIGASRAICAKPGWIEAPRIYVATVARPGSGKSPAEKLVKRPVYRLQNKYKKQFRRETAEYESGANPNQIKDAAPEPHHLDDGPNVPPHPCSSDQDSNTDSSEVLVSDNVIDSLIRGGSNETPSSQVPDNQLPEKPAQDRSRDQPTMRRVIVGDVTTEALATILAHNPRGILNSRDELASWIRGMNQYKGGKGTDRQFFLSCWSGEAAIVDRKSQAEPVIIPFPFVNVLGGIQPDMLHELVDEKGRSDGFLDRILLSYPEPPAPELWSEQGVDPSASQYLEKLLDELFRLKMQRSEEEEVFEPRVLFFSEEAKEVWKRWYNDHTIETSSSELVDTLRDPWMKLKAYLLRLALVLELIHAADIGLEAQVVSKCSVERAVELIDYFKFHARKVYACLFRTVDDRRVEAVLKWIERNGGKCSARDLQRSGVANIKKASVAKAMIADMVDRGLGTLEDLKNEQGKPVTFFVVKQ